MYLDLLLHSDTADTRVAILLYFLVFLLGCIFVVAWVCKRCYVFPCSEIVVKDVLPKLWNGVCEASWSTRVALFGRDMLALAICYRTLSTTAIPHGYAWTHH